MRRLLCAVLAVGSLSTAAGFAEEPAEAPGGIESFARKAALSGGSLRGGYWTSDRRLDDREHFATSALWLQAAPKLGRATALFVEGWVRNEDLLHEEATEGLLREAHLDQSIGPLDLRVGKQLIVWGRADRINPTDKLTPRDFTLLVPEDDDQRLGVVAVKATHFFGNTGLTGVWLPDFEPDVIPVRRPSPPFTLREREPERAVGQWAARMEQTGYAVDWSLSYFDGFDLFPDLGIDRVHDSGIDLLLRHHRIRVLGADAAATVGRYGLRGEAAYTFTENSEGDRFDVKRPFFFMVVGGDRTMLETLNVNVQYILRVISRFRSPVDVQDPLQRAIATEQAIMTNQLDEIQHAASLRVSHKWLHETLEGELTTVLSFTRLDYVVRPKVTYAFTDRWKGTVGADIFRGERRSFLGRLRDNSTAYAELRWSF